LKTQLIGSFLAVTLLVLSVSMYYSFAKTLNIVENKTQQTMKAEFHQIETNILTLLHEVDNLSKTFLYKSDVLSVMESDRLSNAEFLLLEKVITMELRRGCFLSSHIRDFGEDGMRWRADIKR